MRTGYVVAGVAGLGVSVLGLVALMRQGPAQLQNEAVPTDAKSGPDIFGGIKGAVAGFGAETLSGWVIPPGVGVVGGALVGAGVVKAPGGGGKLPGPLGKLPNPFAALG